MQIRQPVVAGQFYPADREECLAEIRECLGSHTLSEPLPDPLVAGIVPHAGWTFSGALAAMVFAAVKKRWGTPVRTFVLFGAAHGYFGSKPALDESDAWETPLGTVQIDESLRQSLVESGTAVVAPSAHRREHSIEVQIPFIQHLFPEARILPIIVPANESAVALGDAVADRVAQAGGIVCIASTDLTHYGPRYGFTPMGIGANALGWASNVNDRQFIDLAVALEPQRLLANAIESGNACGPGAATAAVVVAKRLGAAKGVLLAHTNSNEVMLRQTGAIHHDSVGYAAVVF